MVYTRPVVKVLSCAVRSLVPFDTLRALLVRNQLLHTLRLAGIFNGRLRALAFFGHCWHTNVDRSSNDARCEAVASCLFWFSGRVRFFFFNRDELYAALLTWQAECMQNPLLVVKRTQARVVDLSAPWVSQNFVNQIFAMEIFVPVFSGNDVS